jgi:hypothetical protein
VFTRITMLIFIAVLALPIATLTRPAEARHSSRGAAAVEAKE